MPGGCFRLHRVVDQGSPVAIRDAEMPLNAMRCAVHWFFSSAFGCLDQLPFAVRSFQPGPSCPARHVALARVMHIGPRMCASTQAARENKIRVMIIKCHIQKCSDLGWPERSVFWTRKHHMEALPTKKHCLYGNRRSTKHHETLQSRNCQDTRKDLSSLRTGACQRRGPACHCG